MRKPSLAKVCRVRTLVLGLGFCALPVIAAAAECVYPYLPRPNKPRQVIIEQLREAGLWRPSRINAPPANPQVGDTWDWYIWDLGGYPVATLKPCTVRGMGDNCYVVVDDDEWNVSIDQTAVDRIVTHFEDQSVGFFPGLGIWDLNTTHFGDPPNPLDNLDRVFLLYYRFNIAADGYFWSFDQYPDGTLAFASNEADVVYLATDSGDAGGNYMLGVAAHEFEHMIHYNYDSNEDSWVDEGLGELAMWLFGNPDQISQFNTNPDDSLTTWGGNWADYIQTYLWSLYIYEQYGGQPTILNLVLAPGNGMSGYLNTLTGQGYAVTMEDIFGDWAAANYLDDTTSPNGQYGYSGETLPPFHAFVEHASYPASGSGSVQNWATDYIRLTDFDEAPSIDFNGIDTRDFRVNLLAIGPGLSSLVWPLVLDGANDGYYEFTQAHGYSEVIIEVANVHPSASATYSYTVGTLVVTLFTDGFESGDTSAWSATVP